jgi:hypothetical protein
MSVETTARIPERRRWLIVAAGMLAAALLGAAVLAPSDGDASSHREAPLVGADPQIDNTDVYAFVSPDDPSTVTLISNWIPFEEPAGGPNFYEFGKGVRYDIDIDNDGDARPDLIYRWTFRSHRRNPEAFLYNTGPVDSLTDPDLNFYQTYDLRRIVVGKRTRLLVDDGFVAPNNVGAASMPNYAALSDAAIETFGTNGMSWTGQADDPFFLDLRVFDLVYGGDFSEAGDDTLAGFNTHVMAVQVPKEDLAKDRDAETNPVIGVWSTASRRSVRVQSGDGSVRGSGDFVQVSRLGMPLVNEVVVPIKLKDYWNGSKPRNDAQFLGAVNDPILAHVIEAVYGIPAPDSNPDQPGIQRDDVIAVFLTGLEGLNQPAGVRPSEQLRLNMSITPCEPPGCTAYSRLGVIAGDNAGFPNGRRLADDVIDIALRVVEGVLLPDHNPAADTLGDGVDANELSFRSSFPYVALPHAGSNPAPH